MRYFTYLFLLFIISTNQIFSEEPKREFRAFWVATVFNIDWPSAMGLTIEDQKSEMIRILDTAKDLKFNAIILQIKPTSDAFYTSKLSPWSRYLTGKQGQNPGYDPLAFFIEEAQKRSLETHLWINPFRILNGEGFNTLTPNHIARKNPDWVIEYQKRFYFDPGNTQAQQYIIKEILEIVKKYDLDVLHMDDYFYPYKAYNKGTLIPFKDDKSWNKNKKSFTDRDDWRRNNVNIFVSKLSSAIKSEKPHVQLGISPFGVWRNKSMDPKGSDTSAGQTNYDDLYADVLEWIDKGWIDYILPQIYWHTSTKGVPFDILVDWWNKYTKDPVLLYIGIGVYKLHEQNWPTSYIKEQIALSRKYPNVKGAAFYSARWIVEDTKKIKQTLKEDIYPHFSLIPESTTIKGIKPFQPKKFQLHIQSNNTFLSWENSDPEWTRYFVLYRFNKNESPDHTKAENILGIVSSKEKLEFSLSNHTDQFTYGITSVTRLHQESTLLTLDDMETIKGLEAIDKILSTP